jgi:uncharacterized protein HemY
MESENHENALEDFLSVLNNASRDETRDPEIKRSIAKIYTQLGLDDYR